MPVRRGLLTALLLSLLVAFAAWAPAGPSVLAGLQGEQVYGPTSTEAAPSADTPVPTTVEPVPTTTTTVVPEPEPVLGLRPIPIPRDSYAPEPVVEIGTIEIPAIGLTHRLYDGVTLHNIDRGPSHWPGTAMPGQPGNAVIAGHRVTNSRPFRNLDQLVAGDQVIFTVAGVRSVYSVVDSLTVKPSDTWIALQTPATTATLYACHPPGSQAQRFVVRLKLASDPPAPSPTGPGPVESGAAELANA